MVGAIKTVCSNLRWRKNWDEEQNFNGVCGAEMAQCAETPRMSMGHIVDKVWKHKMLRLGGEPIDPAASK